MYMFSETIDTFYTTVMIYLISQLELEKYSLQIFAQLISYHS